MFEKDKTHVLVAEPEMDVRYLADYMGGSERKRRAVLTAAKYRPKARLLQHREAKAVILSALLKGDATKAFFVDRAHSVRSKIATDDFDALTNEANADYLARFSEVVDALNLAGVEFGQGKAHPFGKVHGLRVPFVSHLTLRRVTKTNKVVRGSLMLRYSKTAPLGQDVADYQTAAIHGFLGMAPPEEGTEIDRSLCVVFDGHSGTVHRAPTTSVTRFKNTVAACETIADAWPNVKPPKGAIL